MNRREFITLLGGAASWPLAARAQQPAKVARIGYLVTGSLESPEARATVSAFLQGLRERGYVEGQSIVIEYRSADGKIERFPSLANELASLKLDLILAPNTPAARAVQHATSTIPIVVPVMGDPVEDGLVASLARPGGNITGLSQIFFALTAKRLEMLHELMGGRASIALLVNPTNPYTASETRAVQATAGALGLQLHVLNATGEQDLATVFTGVAKMRRGAVLVGADPTFTSLRDRLVSLAASNAIPAIYGYREFTVDGGLISYGINIAAAYRQLGLYAGRILKGEKPADLPVMQPTKFELVINLKTAKALGLEIPPTLLARADEVIE
jgi:putative tryptophan/tyrosine transport system substrate-binding protein